jgi:outer membrane protein OmpA-like peptidoglycan-associated protein
MILNRKIIAVLFYFLFANSGTSQAISTGFSISATEADIIATISNKYLFYPQTPALTENGKKIIKTILSKIPPRKSPEIIIEGHTSATAIKDSDKFRYPSNWELAASRAGSVLRYIQANKPKRTKSLVLHSFADTSPIAPNYTIDGRNLNKRVIIRIVFKKKVETIFSKKKVVEKKSRLRPLVEDYLYSDLKSCKKLSKYNLHTFYFDEKYKIVTKSDKDIVNNITNYILHRGRLISVILESKSTTYKDLIDNKKQLARISSIKDLISKDITKKIIKTTLLSTAVLKREQLEDTLSIQIIRCQDNYKPLF